MAHSKQPLVESRQAGKAAEMEGGGAAAEGDGTEPSLVSLCCK